MDSSIVIFGNYLQLQDIDQVHYLMNVRFQDVVDSWVLTGFPVLVVDYNNNEEKVALHQWKEKAKLKPQIVCDNKFWESCDAAFIKGDLSSDDAILFYSEQADLCKSPQERVVINGCHMLAYSL
ncbi:uncharacterized protein LOC142319768 isoform X1 [Lycorma delicatula]|uniref:uncharacterized protein LOC142319768 isoform X1 n=1 Tax=Lycorma delicatula TaxID=130591 RepID=UPI003F51458A